MKGPFIMDYWTIFGQRPHGHAETLLQANNGKESPMDEEQLIELVKVEDVLYNPFHSKYKDWKHKKEIWKGIGKALNQDGEKCKQRWSAIRTRLRKQLSTRLDKSGQVPPARRTYEHENRLQFLLPYLKDKETGNIESKAGGSRNEVDKSRRNKKRKLNKGDQSSLHSQRTKHTIEANREQQTRDSATVDSFVNLVRDKLEALPPYYQSLAMTDITAVLHEIEWDLSESE